MKHVVLVSAVIGSLALPVPAAMAQQANPKGCVESHAAGTDYFPDQVAPRHSSFWDIAYHDTYKVLTVPDSEFPDNAALTYVLVQCGTPAPDLTGDLEGALVVEVPVQRTAVVHNNGLAMLDEIGVLDTVVGVAQGMITNAETDSWFARVLAAGNDPASVGSSSGLDTEMLLGLEPGILIMAGFGPGYTEVSDARGRGLPTVMVSNRIEPTPLGSSEWMKFLAAFYNAEAHANAHFDAIEARYDEVASAVEGQVPAGFSAAYTCIGDDMGCSFMYAHGADSLNGQILATLGVSNPFADGNDAGNGMTFDFESALGRAADTDFFILYYGAEANAQTIANDMRFANFSALAAGNYITGVDAGSAECGATNYVHVDRLIRDYAIGMLPELFPGEEGVCFQRPARD